MPDDRPSYYTHSGSSSPAGVLACTLISVAAGVIGAIVYAWIDFHSPVIYFNCALAGAFGWFVGASVALGARIGRIRSIGVVTYMAAASSVVSYAASWVAWLRIVHSSIPGFSEIVPAIDSPASVWQALAFVYENGTWGVGYSHVPASSPIVNGPLLAMVWLGEAIAVIAPAIWFARARWFDCPYCEPCGAWCSAARPLHVYGPAASAAEVKLRLEQRDWEFLGTITRARGLDVERLELTARQCRRCGEMHMVSLNRLTVVPTRTGTRETRRPVMGHLLVSAQELEIIASIPPAEPAEPEDSPPPPEDYVDLGL